MGRPSTYTEAIAEEICTRLMEGETLVAICQSEGMPHRATVVRWMNGDPDFAARCARAREEQAEYMDHKILAVADASTPETAVADRVKISAYQWRASKLAPKKYGDRLDLNHSGKVAVDVGPDLSTLSDDELAVMRMLYEKAEAAKQANIGE